MYFALFCIMHALVALTCRDTYLYYKRFVAARNNCFWISRRIGKRTRLDMIANEKSVKFTSEKIYFYYLPLVQQ